MSMFTVKEVATSKGVLQYRTERLTGISCRISPDRLQRNLDQTRPLADNGKDCPFCRENIFSVTPTFSDGTRHTRGESVTFPNLYPFSKKHVVTVITRDHTVEEFGVGQIVDAFHGQIEALRDSEGYASINWNYLPSAGASLIHPHMQGLSDCQPSQIVRKYIYAHDRYRRDCGRNYWNDVKEQEQASERYLFGEEIVWSAHAVPVGEREVRGILPVSTLCEIEPYIDLLAEGIHEILAMYRKLGTKAFNMSVFFDNPGTDRRISGFCSLISRINPNEKSTSDSAFMERLHLEPVIMTLPEDLGKFYKKEKN